MPQSLKFFLILWLFFLSSFINLQAQGNNCEEIRAAFDIGSGTTKMVVAKVNHCLNQRGQILLERSIPIPFKSSLDNSADQQFDQKIQNHALDQLGKLKEEASNFFPKKFVAVGTQAFRTAKNGEELAKKIERMIGIHFLVIDQRTEAILGYMAATQGKNQFEQEILVWDIGGASMQMTYLDKAQNYITYEGQLASVSFKNMVITALQGKDYMVTASPNPLGVNIGKKALNLAEYYAKTHLPLNLKESAAKGKVLGIGSLHQFSILKNINSKATAYKLTEVLSEYDRKKNLTDSQLKSDYAATDVTNLALVAGFMKELKIEQVEVIDVNMAHGILTYPGYWQ